MPEELDFGKSYLSRQSDTLLEVVLVGEDIEWFTELVRRGSNLWPDAPAAAKEFHDQLRHGKLLQDYRSQPK